MTTCWRGDCFRKHFSCLYAGERSLNNLYLVLLLGTAVAVESAQKMGHTHGVRMCIERPHSLAKLEGIVQTGKYFSI